MWYLYNPGYGYEADEGYDAIWWLLTGTASSYCPHELWDTPHATLNHVYRNA